MTRLALTLLVLGGGAFAGCRTGEPGDDPRTPANAPLPEIHRDTDKDAERPPRPSLFGKDAG